MASVESVLFQVGKEDNVRGGMAGDSSRQAWNGMGHAAQGATSRCFTIREYWAVAFLPIEDGVGHVLDDDATPAAMS